MRHGPWSDCLPIEFGHGTDHPETVFKLAAWKTKRVHRDATFLSRLVNSDNIVRLVSIVTVEGRFAGYGMDLLYELRSPLGPTTERLKEMLPDFIQETVEYLHQTAHIYHCDIRMGNIMVNGQGRLKLVDFDIAEIDVSVSPRTYFPTAQFFLGICQRLDYLDVGKLGRGSVWRISVLDPSFLLRLQFSGFYTWSNKRQYLISFNGEDSATFLCLYERSMVPTPRLLVRSGSHGPLHLVVYNRRQERCLLLNLINSVANDKDEGFDPHTYTGGRWLRHDKLERDSRYIKFNFSALCPRVLELCPGAESITSYQKTEGGFNRVFIFTLSNAKRVVARLPFTLAGPSKLATTSEVATIKYRNASKLITNSFIVQAKTSIPIPPILDWSNDSTNSIGSEYIIMEHAADMAADQQVRCIDAIYWKAKEVVDIFRISRFQEPSFFVDSPLDSGHKTPLDEMFCIGPHYGSRYWDCNVNELKYYHNKNLIMAHMTLLL
ncbi:hypothetical protein I7I51_08286 [Histoplasma capsulatum]|uniref:Altered inheritance of mitochondria protein 9, mitochondrial n=1 Tax=Ajellomyces capsulatus TaxID=5037 RepID=A0A8A1M3U4_AJECA|nr:hypothetical protein I7I51_08286 [Histoplasma capsulatum]